MKDRNITVYMPRWRLAGYKHETFTALLTALLMVEGVPGTVKVRIPVDSDEYPREYLIGSTLRMLQESNEDCRRAGLENMSPMAASGDEQYRFTLDECPTRWRFYTDAPPWIREALLTFELARERGDVDPQVGQQAPANRPSLAHTVLTDLRPINTTPWNN